MLQRLTVLIDADVQRFASAIQSVNGGLSGLARQAQQMGSVLSVALSAPLGLLGKRAVETFGEMDGLRRGLATLEKDAASLTTRLGVLNEVAKLPGLGMKEAIQFDVSLRSAGFSAELSRRSMVAFGNALATVGKGKNELRGVSVQLQQLATKQSGFGADLRIIKEYAPQTGAALMKAFGTIDTEAIAKTGVTGRQVIEKIVGELEKLPSATGSAKNTFENFGDSITRTMDSIGGSLFKSLRIGPILESIAGFVEKLGQKFGNLPSTMQTVIGSFGLLLVVVPPLIAGIGFFTTTILPALRAGLIATRTAMLLMTGPIGLIVAAIAAAAILIIMHWDRIKSALVSTGIWTQLKDIVKSALGVVTSIFGVFANLFQGDWGMLWESLKNTFKYAWNGIISLIGAGILAAGGLLAKGLSIFGLDSWSKSVMKEMDAVKGGLKDVKFEIAAPTFNPFAGFQFGGQNAVDGSQVGGNGKKGKGKKEKFVEDPTTLQVLERIRQHIEEQMQDMRAMGRDIGDDLAHELTTVENQIARIKGEAAKSQEIKTDNNPFAENIKGLVDKLAKQADYAKSRLNDFIKDGVLGYLSDQLKKLQGVVSGLTFAGLKIPSNVTTSIKDYVNQIDRMNTLGERGTLANTITVAQADGGWSSSLAVAGKMQDMAIANFNRNRERVILSAKDMATAVTGTLQQGAGAAAEAMGGFIAGLIDGTRGIQDLPKIILGVFADMLQSLATALAASAAVMLFVPGLQAQAAAQFAGAAGLFAVSGLARSFAQPKKMANGNYVTGSTYSLTGEYDGANLHRNGEFVAPVRKGARLLVEEMAAQGGMGGGGEKKLVAELSGSMIRIALERDARGKKTYGG